MKVLIIFNHPAPYKVKLFNKLAEKVDLFVIFERSSAKDRPAEFYNENKYNFNHIFVNKGNFGNENSLSLKIKKFIKKNYKDYDFIIMNGYSTLSEQFAIRYMIKKHIPYLLLVNGGIAKEKECFIKRYLKKRYISNAKVCLSPNEQTNKYLRFYGAKGEIINYPYCTYFEKDIKEANIPSETRASLREKYNLPSGKLFISASNFILRKNNIELFDSIKDEDCSLVLYGNGPLKEQYENYLNQNKIKNIFIREFISMNELMDIMSCCDGFITLSKEDIYGHTTIEALASGIPVISSQKVISSVSVIENGKNGFLVSNKQDIKQAISKVNYSQMSEKCIEVAKQFSIEKEVEEIVRGLGGINI